MKIHAMPECNIAAASSPFIFSPSDNVYDPEQQEKLASGETSWFFLTGRVDGPWGNKSCGVHRLSGILQLRALKATGDSA